MIVRAHERRGLRRCGAVWAHRKQKVHKMLKLEVGDLVVLVCGSMRMGVEGVDGDQVACVWCHEGEIGRDVFDLRLLRKWEHKEDSDRSSGPRPFKGPRDGGGKPYGDRPKGRPAADEKPKGKPGWDGKPREKKFFRKD